MLERDMPDNRLLETSTEENMCDPVVQGQLLTLAERFAAGSDDDKAGYTRPVRDLAGRLAGARQRVLFHNRPLRIGVVFAMWREAVRIRDRSTSNPLGENCIGVKAQTLDWLFRDTKFEWKMYAVDDGCDQGSGQVAREFAAASKWRHKIQVLDLRDSPLTQREPLRRLRSADESVKGGAIILGCLAAVEAGCDIVVYTDCDNSVSVGQLGNLLDPVISRRLKFAMGDRDLPGSTLWRSPRRYSSKRFVILKHIRSMLCEMIGLTDFTTPLKLFSSDILLDIVDGVSVFNFAFDYDVVLSALSKGYRPASVEYSSYDSFDESSWHHYGVPSIWFDQFTGLVSSLRRHSIPHNVELANFVSDRIKSPADVEALVGLTVPEPLLSALSSDVGRQTTFSAAELVAWADQLRELA